MIHELLSRDVLRHSPQRRAGRLEDVLALVVEAVQQFAIHNGNLFVEVGLRFSFLHDNLDHPTALLPHSILVAAALAHDLADEPVHASIVHIAADLASARADAFLPSLFVVVQILPVERGQFEDEGGNDGGEVHVYRPPGHSRDAAERVGVTLGDGPLQQARDEIGEELPAPDAQYAREAIESPGLGVLVVPPALHGDQQYRHHLVHGPIPHGGIQTLEARRAQLSHPLVLVAQCVLDGLDQYVEVLVDVLLGRAADDLVESDTNATAGVLVPAVEGVAKDRDDLGEDSVPQLPHDVAEAPSRDLRALGVARRKGVDDLTHQHAQDLAESSRCNADERLPHLDGDLPYDRGRIAPGKVQLGQQTFPRLAPEDQGDLRLGPLGLPNIVLRVGLPLDDLGPPQHTEEISEESEGRHADAMIVVGQSLLQRGQDLVDVRLAVTPDHDPSSPQCDVPDRLGLVGQSAEEGGEGCVDERGKALPHRRGEEREDPQYALPGGRLGMTPQGQDLVRQDGFDRSCSSRDQDLGQALGSARPFDGRSLLNLEGVQ
mmetsp:Transcript_5986/g.17325  ORF Transcript_5986/g.17325 Transcript_5986/m.17325 type:complete len:546 (-) Transcript_5986:6459-8096(-)